MNAKKPVKMSTETALHSFTFFYYILKPSLDKRMKLYKNNLTDTVFKIASVHFITTKNFLPSHELFLL